MHLPTVILLAGAAIAAAHPSGHAHLHREVHERRDGHKHKFFRAERPHIPIPTPTTTPAEPAAPSIKSHRPPPPPAKPKPSAEPANEYIPFCSEGGHAKRVTVAQVHYKGFTGMANGCPWNSNMMQIPNNIADKYDYVQTYKNVDKVPYEVRCFNKIGPDDGLTGMFSVNKDKQLRFMLAPGETKSIAFQPNTQGVCAFAPNEIPLTEFGQLAGNWAEFDWENTSNNGWSGADCSSLVAQRYDMDVPGCFIEHAGVKSIIYPGGRGVNAYTKGMEKLDGIGLNIPPGPALMTILVGYH